MQKLQDSGIEEVLKVNIIACINCDKIFKSDADFYTHAKACKPNRENLQICPFCRRKLRNGSSVEHLYIHVKKFHSTESESVPFKKIEEEFALMKQRVQCEKCGNHFASRHSLENHMRSLHVNETFTCTICDSTFNSKRYLHQHKIIHNIEPTIPCEYCGQVYRKEARLTMHIKRVHLQIRNFGCDICGKRFKSGKQLRDHSMAIHEKLKPYSCLLCSFECTKYGNLNLHRNKKHRIESMPKAEYLKLSNPEDKDAK